MKRFKYVYFFAAMMLLIVGKTYANNSSNSLKPPIVLMGSFNDKTTYKNLMHKALPRNKQWLGLFCHNTDCEIKPAQVKISDYVEKWELNGDLVTSDKLDVKDKPLALFLGVPNIKTGKVTTWSLGSNSINTPQLESPYGDETINKIPFYKQLHSKAGWQIPWNIRRKMTLSREITAKKPINPDSYIEDISVLKLTNGLNTQVLLKIGAFNYHGVPTLPLIDWIGDLDNDGQVDLLINTVTECGYDYRLFISSLADRKKGEMVRNIAKTEGMLARCGC
jgi:hypothetical protein